MRIIRNRPGHIDSDGVAIGPCVVAIGNFDGVHRGHLALLQRCRERRREGETVAVMTFEPLPQAFFRPQQAPARLSTVHQKLSMLREAGADLVWLMRFGGELARMPAVDFVRQALKTDLNATSVVVGEDFRFGCGRKGDVAMLRELGGKSGFEVSTVAAVTDAGERISSSGIRALLADGEFQKAGQGLGRPFRMEGHVVRGAMLGRKLGFPTANLKIRAHPSPVHGVFAVFARVIGGNWLPGVANLGCRPAVGGKEPLLEVHFFDFDQNLYGKRLEVQFVAKLRDELNFDSMGALVEQMNEDAKQARACLAGTRAPE